MITLKYGDINNTKLVGAFKAIKREKLPLPASCRFTKIAEKLDQHIISFQKEYQEFLTEHSEKDEAGLPVTEKNERGQVVGYKMADAAGSSKVIGEMFEKEFTIDVNPVEVADLANVTISPDVLSHLSPFINGLDTLA